jgi:esterase/lipase superfamily enzyme
VGLLLVIATGCAAVGKSASEPPPNPPDDVMRLYFATDRAPVQANAPFFGAERGGLKFGHADVAVMIENRPGEGAVQRPPTTRPARQSNRWVRDLRELDQQQLLAGGDAAGGIGDQPVLIFVHGYNVAPESALATAAQLAYDIGFTGAAVAFVWPSRASLDRYASDEESAQWAAPHLAELIRHLKNKSDRPVHIIAHSMGTRVACGALQRLGCGRDAVKLPRLGHVILAAADIDADIFKAQIADEIRPLVSSLTLYASRNDAALRLSQQIHQWTRAGESGDWVPAGEQRFEMVDCTGVDLSKSVGNDLIGHSYYAADHVTEDMQSVLGTSTRPRAATRPAGARYLRLPPPRAAPAWTRR